MGKNIRNSNELNNTLEGLGAKITILFQATRATGVAKANASRGQLALRGRIASRGQLALRRRMLREGPEDEGCKQRGSSTIQGTTLLENRRFYSYFIIPTA